MKRVLFILMLMTIGLSAQAAEELKVGGVTVNLNKNSTYQSNMGIGYFTYNYQEKKLVFYSVIMVGQIWSSVKDLNIVFSGDNTIINYESEALRLVADTHLTTTGKVTITSKLDSSHDEYSNSFNIIHSKIDISGGVWNFNGRIYLKKDDSTEPKLTIKDAIVNVTMNLGNACGIDGVSSNPNNDYYGKIGLVEVDNSTLTVETNKAYCIDAMVILKNSVIAKPINAALDNDGSIYHGENHTGGKLLYDTKHDPLTNWLIINPGTAYDLWICGVRVNSENIGDIWKLESTGVSSEGRLTYNPSTKRLDLNEATLNSEYVIYPPIYSKVDNLNIVVNGTCYIGNSEESGWVGINSRANCTIRGSGFVRPVLNVNGHSSDYGNAIKVEDGSTMNIYNLTLNAQGDRYGLYGYECTINPYNSHITLGGSKQALYVYDTNFDPNGECAILYPVNGIRKGTTIYEPDGNTPAKYVELGPKPDITTGVRQMDMDSGIETDAPTRVYTTTGQLVWQGTGQPQLPSGIYIVNGTKVVIK